MPVSGFSKAASAFDIEDTLPVVSLRLSDGTRWFIQGDRKTRQWMDSLVSIMRLEYATDGNADFTLHFLPISERWHSDEFVVNGKESADCLILQGRVPSSLDETGWQCLDFRTLRIWHEHNANDFFCEVEAEEEQIVRYINLWRCLYPVYLRSIYNGGLPLHSALVAHKNDAYLLSGRGGMGKSTACSRLPAGWMDCCDDETLVVRMGGDCYSAHPFPTWSEYLYQRSQKTWDVQDSWPLRALFFIEHSSTDWVRPVGKGESAGLINQSALQTCKRFFRMLEESSRRRLSLQIFTNACEMARSVPAFRMGMTLTGRFWEMMLDAAGES